MTSASQENHECVLVAFLKSLPVGTRFPASQWPLHLTLVGPFAFTGGLESLVRDLHELAASTPSFKVRVGKDALFGHNKDILVALVHHHETLQDFHDRLLEILVAHGATLRSPRHAGVGYRPHVTDSKGLSPNEPE